MPETSQVSTAAKNGGAAESAILTAASAAAAKKGDAAEVSRLLAAGAPLWGVHEKYGWNLLHIAAAYGQVDTCKVLIDANIDVNKGSVDNETPLHLAAQQGQESAIRYLVEEGANVNATNDDGETPLHVACASLGDKGVDHLETLLELRAVPSIRRFDGHTPMSLLWTHMDGGADIDNAIEILRRFQDQDSESENEYDTGSLLGSSQASTDINTDDEYDTESLSGSSQTSGDEEPLPLAPVCLSKRDLRFCGLCPRVILHMSVQ